MTGFPKLRSLDISGIAAWQQLPQLPEGVTQLDISHTAVTDIRTLTEASYHDLILSYQTTMDWETLGACNTYQFTVLDCPLDRQPCARHLRIGWSTPRSCRCRAMNCCQRLCGERSALADTCINKKGC